MGNCRLGVPQRGNSSATNSALMITTKLGFVDARRHLHRRCRMSVDRPPTGRAQHWAYDLIADWGARLPLAMSHRLKMLLAVPNLGAGGRQLPMLHSSGSGMGLPAYRPFR
jgi:hypothetical protein